MFFFSILSLIHTPPEPTFKCQYNPEMGQRSFNHNEHESSASLRIDSKVLVFVETQFSRLGREICVILEANRMK